ncbi:MAG: hypothetical protein ACQEQV_07965 [Fibrobacterota bacterium]
MNTALLIFSSLSFLSSAIAVTVPEVIHHFIQRMNQLDSGKPEEAEDALSRISPLEKAYLALSSSQLLLVPLLTFSSLFRFRIYGVVFLAIYLLSMRFRKQLFSSPRIILAESVIELIICADIIRSCIHAVFK